jgi:LmbE family N-acetylglucosaminyl deacetylase
MRMSQILEQTRHLPITTRSQLTGDAPFVVLSPHPDDETLGLGGLIRQARDVGQRVVVVVLTDGAGSHTNSAAYPASRLIALRKQELFDASQILGLDAGDLHHFDQPDAGAPSSGPAFDQAVNDLADILRRTGACNLFVTWRHDPHRDHSAAAAVAEAAVDLCPSVGLWAYPIWGWHLDLDTSIPIDSPSGYRIDITREREVKARAIAAHRSQMTDLISDDPAGFRFSPQTLKPFLGRYEYIYTMVP